MSIDRKGEREREGEREKFSVDTQCKWMEETIDPCLLVRLNPGDRLLTLFWNGMREKRLLLGRNKEKENGER